jgi:hypothetical protein
VPEEVDEKSNIFVNNRALRIKGGKMSFDAAGETKQEEEL